MVGEVRKIVYDGVTVMELIDLFRARSARQRAYYRGLWAERWVCCWFWCCGYRILARRLRTPVAEIDLLLRHRFIAPDHLVAVEVKVRQNLDDALMALRPAQQHRLRRAGLWLSSSGYMRQKDSLRWDYVVFASRRWPRHLRNVL